MLKIFHDPRKNPLASPPTYLMYGPLNRKDYEKSFKNLLNDKTKFKELLEDVTIKRESKLQRFLRTLKNNKRLDDAEYEKIYPSGSSPTKIYGSPKMHNPFDSNSPPSFRPIVSSIGTYNYNISKYLCKLLSPDLPNEFSQKIDSHLWRS